MSVHEGEKGAGGAAGLARRIHQRLLATPQRRLQPHLTWLLKRRTAPLARPAALRPLRPLAQPERYATVRERPPDDQSLVLPRQRILPLAAFEEPGVPSEARPWQEVAESRLPGILGRETPPASGAPPARTAPTTPATSAPAPARPAPSLAEVRRALQSAPSRPAEPSPAVGAPAAPTAARAGGTAEIRRAAVIEEPPEARPSPPTVPPSTRRPAAWRTTQDAAQRATPTSADRSAARRAEAAPPPAEAAETERTPSPHAEEGRVPEPSRAEDLSAETLHAGASSGGRTDERALPLASAAPEQALAPEPPLARPEAERAPLRRTAGRQPEGASLPLPPEQSASRPDDAGAEAAFQEIGSVLQEDTAAAEQPAFAAAPPPLGNQTEEVQRLAESGTAAPRAAAPAPTATPDRPIREEVAVQSPTSPAVSPPTSRMPASEEAVAPTPFGATVQQEGPLRRLPAAEPPQSASAQRLPLESEQMEPPARGEPAVRESEPQLQVGPLQDVLPTRPRRESGPSAPIRRQEETRGQPALLSSAESTAPETVIAQGSEMDAPLPSQSAVVEEPRVRGVPLQQALFGATGGLVRRTSDEASSRIVRREATPPAGPEDMAEPSGPALQVTLVQRQAEVTQESAAPAGEAEGQPSAQQPDMDALAEEVYQRLRERLRVERERLGGNAPRWR